MTITERSFTNQYGSSRFFMDDQPGTFRIDTSSPEFIPAQIVYGFDVCAHGDSLRDQEHHPSIECDGYGCVTVLKVPLDMATQVLANLKELVRCMALGTFDQKTWNVSMTHGFWRAAMLLTASECWVFIVDSVTSNSNYGFLLNDTAAAIEDGEWFFELEHRDAGAMILSGNENSDNQFSDWLHDTDLSVYEQLLQYGWISLSSY